jgi:hypothetical protein
MTVTRYRKRPVEVDTIQWTGANEAELIEFTGHRFEAIPVEDRAEDPDLTAQVYDELHNTWVGVKTGQHIVRGVAGEYYPIAEDVLAATYQRVDQTAAEPDTTRVTALYEQWVKAGPPPLGAPLARWWDRRLAELRAALNPQETP